MTNSQRLSQVRALLLRWLGENCAPKTRLACVDFDSDCDRSPELESEQAPEQAAELSPEPVQEQDDGASSNQTSPEEMSPEETSPENSDPVVTGLDRPADSTDAAESSIQIVSESILIRDGYYAGRTFSTLAFGERFKATWFMEPDELKIHGSDGNIVAVFRGDRLIASGRPSTSDAAILPMPSIDKRDESEGDDALPQAA